MMNKAKLFIAVRRAAKCADCRAFPSCDTPPRNTGAQPHAQDLEISRCHSSALLHQGFSYRSPNPARVWADCKHTGDGGGRVVRIHGNGYLKILSDAIADKNPRYLKFTHRYSSVL